VLHIIPDYGENECYTGFNYCNTNAKKVIKEPTFTLFKNWCMHIKDRYVVKVSACIWQCPTRWFKYAILYEIYSTGRHFYARREFKWIIKKDD
jgi:hypothetical protein